MKDEGFMGDSGYKRYSAALDASMIVATAKLFIFNLMWKELKEREEIRRMPKGEAEMARRHLRQAIASMDDTLFFFPPDETRSKENFNAEIEHRFRTGLKERILEEFKRQVRSQDPTLSKYL